MRLRSCFRMLRAAVAAVTMAIVLPVCGATLYDCATGTGAGEQPTTHGFYVTNFPGSRLQLITLHYSAQAPGIYIFGINAHIGAYNGPIIGGGVTSVLLTGNDTDFRPITFPFPPVPIQPGSTIAFTTTFVSGPSAPVFAETTTYGSCPNLIETVDTSPPLSSPQELNGVSRGFVATLTGTLAPVAVPALQSGMLVALMFIVVLLASIRWLQHPASHR